MSMGIVIDRAIVTMETGTWAMLTITSIALACLIPRRHTIASLLILVAVLTTGAGWHHHLWNDRADDDLTRSATDDPRPVWVRGVIAELLGTRTTQGYAPGDPDRTVTRMVLQLSSLHDGQAWQPTSGRAILIVGGDCSDVHAGQPVEVAGQLTTIAGPLNPGEFDYRDFLRAQQIRMRIVVDSQSGLTADPEGREWLLTRWLEQIRSTCRTHLATGLEPRTAALAGALILGQRDDIDPEVNDAFARTGTTHLLAISGLQLQVLAYSLGRLLRLTGLPRRMAYLAVALATIGYALLVGLAPSVVRSAVMTLAFCLGAMVDHPTRPANTMALAGVVTLCLNPFFLFDVGCQLSFLAIAGLIWLVPLAHRGIQAIVSTIRARLSSPPSPLDALELPLESWWRKSLHWAAVWLGLGILTSLVVWLSALPLVASRFHLVAPIGVLLNIPLIPITSLALSARRLRVGAEPLMGSAGMARDQGR